MRICLISREYPPDSGWGGIGTYTHNQAHALRKLGHDVEVIAFTANVGAKDSFLIEEGVLVHRVAQDRILPDLATVRSVLPYAFYVLQATYALSSKFFERHKSNPFDLVEVPEHLAEGFGLALTGVVPLVVRLHTPHFKLVAERFHNLKPSFEHRCISILERFVMTFADLITSPSGDIAGYIRQEMNLAEDAIHSIANPVDTKRFAPEGPVKLSYGADKIVLFVGRLEERKGIYTLIEAVPKILTKFPHAKIVLVGSDTNTANGGTSVYAEIQSQLSHSGNAQAVKFISHVPLSEMPEYYRSAAVCVLPSWYDNAPCTVLESMACGKAVVLTSAGGSAEYVVAGESGLVVPPRNSDALAEAISSLLSDTQKCKAMGQQARQRVLEKYDSTLIANQSVAKYEIAVERYLKRKNDRKLYAKTSDELFDDTRSILTLTEKMLYNFLYTQSLIFRIKHRIRRVSLWITDKLSILSSTKETVL